MIPHLLYYQLVILGLLWLFVRLHAAWPSRGAPAQGTSAQPITPRRQRSKELKPFAGLTHQPFCAACAHDSTLPQPPPPSAARSDARDPSAPSSGRPLDALLSACPLGLSRWAGPGELACQRASEWWPLAAMLLHGLRGLFPGDPRHAIAWQARRARPAGVGGGRAGRGLGHPCRGPGV